MAMGHVNPGIWEEGGVKSLRMSAEKDKNAGIWAAHVYTPEEIGYILFLGVTQNPKGKYTKDLLKTIELLNQLPVATVVRFNLVTHEVEVGTNRGEIKTT